MLKISLILFILVFNTVAINAKTNLDSRREKILSIIDEELSEVKRLSDQEQNKDPNLLLRAAELNLEKARLWRDQENEKYLSVPANERDQNKKNEYFQNSAKYFKEGNKYALAVTANFPKYKNIGAVYYVLAFNSKELADYKAAQKYLALAVEYSPKNSKNYYKAQIALAESYFNEKEYSKALPLYQSSVGKVDEKWWTKDAYNMSWSAYRLKSYDKAIEIMKEVIKKSGNSKYINMRNSAYRDIAFFYADSSQIKEGINYFEKEKLNFIDYIPSIAPNMISQGRFAQADLLFSELHKKETSPKNDVILLFYELDLYDKSGQYENHLRVSTELVSYFDKKILSEDQIKVLKFQVTKKAAQLQKATTTEFYKNVPEVRRKRSDQAIQYFALQGRIDNNKNDETLFFQAETAFGSENYSKALPLYISSFDMAKQTNNSSLIQKSVEGMLATLGHPKISKTLANENYANVYERYLSVDSKSDKAKTIFQKLFKVYLDKNDYVNAEKVTHRYAAAFPSDFQTQEAMLAPVMDNYKNKKDFPKVKEYISAINSGKFKVSEKYAKTLKALLTKIQIQDVQSSMDKGDKVVALKGYHRIYSDPESTAKAKSNAAYNLSALYYESSDIKNSYLWTTVSIKEMEIADVLKFSDSFLAISSMLFARQRCAQAADVSLRLLTKICNQNSSYKNLSFKNGLYLALAEKNLTQAEEFISLAERCGVDPRIVNEARLEFIKDLIKEKRIESAELQLSKLEDDMKVAPHSIISLEVIKKTYQSIGDSEKVNLITQKQRKIFESAKMKKEEIPLEAADIIANEEVSKVQSKANNIVQMPLSFPEDVFNKTVKTKLALLDQLTNEISKVRTIGSGRGTVATMNILIDSYSHFAMELKNFKPDGKSEEYITSFQNAMSKVYQPLLQNANVQRQEVKGLINKYKILANEAFDLFYKESDQFVKRYDYQKESVLMDRGGKR
jgi:hypothetical protein